MPEHAALITALILDRPMCLPCIAKADMSVIASRRISNTSVSSWFCTTHRPSDVRHVAKSDP
jgi:hypothetical protein